MCSKNGGDKDTYHDFWEAFIQNYVYQSVKIHLFGDSFALGAFVLDPYLGRVFNSVSLSEVEGRSLNNN